MGCQCNKKTDEEELENESPNQLNEELEQNNKSKEKEDIHLPKKEQIVENKDQIGTEINPLKEQEQDEDYLEKLEKLNEEKNIKYAEYPDKMLEIINKIRENPPAYADIIEDSVKYIVEEPDKEDETKNKIIFKKKVKVALTRGEPAFYEVAEKLRQIEPLPPLEFNGNICIPLPQNEEDLNTPNYLKEQVKALKESQNIDLYFKDLIKLPDVAALLMIVDDNSKNTGRKRNAILNKDFKYIGINSHFIGKTFLAYYSFSK